MDPPLLAPPSQDWVCTKCCTRNKDPSECQRCHVFKPQRIHRCQITPLRSTGNADLQFRRSATIMATTPWGNFIQFRRQDLIDMRVIPSASDQPNFGNDLYDIEIAGQTDNCNVLGIAKSTCPESYCTQSTCAYFQQSAELLRKADLATASAAPFLTLGTIPCSAKPAQHWISYPFPDLSTLKTHQNSLRLKLPNEFRITKSAGPVLAAAASASPTAVPSSPPSTKLKSDHLFQEWFMSCQGVPGNYLRFATWNILRQAVFVENYWQSPLHTAENSHHFQVRMELIFNNLFKKIHQAAETGKPYAFISLQEVDFLPSASHATVRSEIFRRYEALCQHYNWGMVFDKPTNLFLLYNKSVLSLIPHSILNQPYGLRILMAGFQVVGTSLKIMAGTMHLLYIDGAEQLGELLEKCHEGGYIPLLLGDGNRPGEEFTLDPNIAVLTDPTQATNFNAIEQGSETGPALALTQPRTFTIQDERNKRPKSYDVCLLSHKWLKQNPQILFYSGSKTRGFVMNPEDTLIYQKTNHAHVQQIGPLIAPTPGYMSVFAHPASGNNANYFQVILCYPNPDQGYYYADVMPMTKTDDSASPKLQPTGGDDFVIRRFSNESFKRGEVFNQTEHTALLADKKPLPDAEIPGGVATLWPS